MQLFMKTFVVSVINQEKSTYLVLQALLVVCVYLIFECYDFQARPRSRSQSTIVMGRPEII